jgi:uncharacterized membrane protein YkvA (DUF1232 family)
MKDFKETMKRLFSLEGLISIGVSATALWFLGTWLNLIPDAIPVLGHVDNVGFAVLGVALGGLIYRAIVKKKKGK